MNQVIRTTLNCPHCGHRFPAIIEQILDVGRDPQIKARFLSGRLNMIPCPNCGQVVGVSAPLLYHDPAKELLLIHVPMELNISPLERENLIGDLTRRLTDSLPQEQRRAYLLQPRQALTIPGLIDMILEADGITQEMREAQREKLRVIEMFLQVSPDQWERLIQEQAKYIDGELFELLLATAENAAATGKNEMSEGLIYLYEYLVQHTAIGQEMLATAQAQQQTVQEVAERLQAMGEKMTRDDFMALVIEYAGDEERLQAVAGLMRPALDYAFFQELTRRIERAGGAERERLEHLRERLVELTTAIDEQTQAVLQRAAQTLRTIASSEDVDAAIRAHLDQLDDTFLAVLQANIQAARQANDTRSAERLELVLERLMVAMRDSAPPQIRLINDLISAESDAEARQLLAEQAPSFGPELVEIMDAILADLDGHAQPDSVRRVRELRKMAAQLVGSGR
ncbi:MAG: hypothetical protein KJ047_07140 [Anaerolineae bacterium]|nr:hypothetical protein [Anaerolineae bacterium]